MCCGPVPVAKVNSMPLPKTIQIFLPHGDPQGIRVAEITTRIVQVIEIPRSLVGEFLKMPESDQVAVARRVELGEHLNVIVPLGREGRAAEIAQVTRRIAAVVPDVHLEDA